METTTNTAHGHAHTTNNHSVFLSLIDNDVLVLSTSLGPFVSREPKEQNQFISMFSEGKELLMGGHKLRVIIQEL